MICKLIVIEFIHLHAVKCFQILLYHTNSSIWPIDGTLTGTMTLGQSEPGSNSNERVLQFSKAPELEPQYQMV